MKSPSIFCGLSLMCVMFVVLLSYKLDLGYDMQKLQPATQNKREMETGKVKQLSETYGSHNQNEVSHRHKNKTSHHHEMRGNHHHHGSKYDITIVTQYVNIGRFKKGRAVGHYYTTEGYKTWLKTYGWLTNRVIAFFDDDKVLKHFRKIRSRLPKEKTVIIKIKRKDLPAFRHYEKLKKIFASPSYPKHPPNTINASYSCATNSKPHALQVAMDRGLVHTEYLAWLDIGYFRKLLEKTRRPPKDTFTLQVPEGFNSSRVGFSEIAPRSDMAGKSPWDMIRQNFVWVAGGLILGTQKVLREYVVGFEEAFKWLVAHNMSSTDQQTITAMYSSQMIQKQKVEVTTYKCTDGQFGLYKSDILYYCLGYICKEAAEKRKY